MTNPVSALQAGAPAEFCGGDPRFWPRERAWTRWGLLTPDTPSTFFMRQLGTPGPIDLLYVGSADRCDASKGGWYYDVDPKMGNPTPVQICASNCRSFKADPGGSIELRFGCLTRIN
jgi:hypothetical protein